mmetsp:Transcript_103888/g.300473  ORF Transcript_103888/g.300473 Transcript_103888/m.300473 type:complete len:1397 (-) Transcript_103888:30-4220(-)
MTGVPDIPGGQASGKTLTEHPEQALLPDDLTTALEQTIRQKRGAVGPAIDDQQAHASGHSHGRGKPVSIFAAIASGLVNYLLMFGLCCAYGMIMFGEANARHRALAVKMNMCTSWTVGLALAAFCNIRVAIGGPDLTPIVFIAGFIAEMSKDIAQQLQLEYPVAQLSSASAHEDNHASEWCVGAHAEAHFAECADYHEQLRSTVVFAVAVSSAALGLLFFLSGRFNFTRYASYVPTCVMEAFLSCVGYKVFKYALYFCNHDVKQFAPAAMIGVPLYFVKAYHVGNPALVIPLMLFIPLAIFYVGVFASGKNLEHETVKEWMFPQMDNVDFWAVWEWSIGSPTKVNFKAWLKTMPHLAVMVVVCFIDCLLKVLGTEGKLPVKVDKDREMQLFGACNVLTTLSGSSVGYMQLKFNVINAGILGSVEDRNGGLVYTLLCAVTWFWTIEHFNFLPRFFLSTLLFFAGSGFVAENLWGSRKYLSLGEWFQILVILGVFIIAKDLLYAVLVGILLTCADFILTYARVPCVVEPPVRRAELSCVRRTPMVQRTLDHVLNRWLLIVRLKGFIFFASAQTLVAQIRDMIQAEKANGVPPYQRLRFVLFDCSVMDGMDASTAKILRKLKSEAAALKVDLLWTHVGEDLEARLRTQELVSGGQQTFADTDEALHSIEEYLLSYQKAISARWIRLSPTFALQQRFTAARVAFEPFAEVFDDTSRHGCPWRYCSGVTMKKYSTLLWTPGQMDVGLFLVHTGSVALFRELPDLDPEVQKTWPSPIAVYTQGWFLNRESLLFQPTKHFAVALEDGELVTWSRHQWRDMDRETPRMASTIARAVMKQQAADAEHASRSKKEDFLPEVMHNKIRAIRVSRALGAFKMYDISSKAEETLLPPMPTTLQRDVRTAFATFCVAPSTTADLALNSAVGGEKPEPQTGFTRPAKSSAMPCVDASRIVPENARLPANLVANALMFAGIFNTPLSLSSESAALTLEEFNQIAHEAAMLRLSDTHVDQLTKCFKQFDKDSSGSLDLPELAATLSSMFSHRLEPEEIEALIAEWAEDTKTLDLTKFIALTSRLARTREHDWQLMQGVEEVLSKLEPLPNTSALRWKLKLETLMAVAPDLTEEQAREMMWMADWRTGGKRGGKVIDFSDFICAVLLSPMGQAGKLPPSPVEHHLNMRTMKSRSTADLGVDSLRSSTVDDEDLVDPRLMFKHLKDEDTEQEEEEAAPEALKPTCRRNVYLLLEDPTSSRAAQILWFFMGMFILVSVLVMVIHPLVSQDSWKQTKAWESTGEARVWWGFEAFVTVVFTIEYLLRLLVSDAMGTQTKLGFIIEPSNVCDLVAILPFYIELLVSDGTSSGYKMLRVVRLLRLTRITRISRLAKKHPLFGPVAMVMLVIWFIYLKTAA